MTARQRKLTIHVAAALLVLGAAVVSLAGLLLPADVVVPEPSLRLPDAAQPSGISSNPVTSDQPGLAALRQACQRPLRAPLFDDQTPTTTVTPDVPQTATVMNLRLVGTILEAGHSMAMFAKPDGSIVLCAEGQTTAPEDASVTVERVTYQNATVRHNGKPLQLTLPKPPEPTIDE